MKFTLASVAAMASFATANLDGVTGSNLLGSESGTLAPVLNTANVANGAGGILPRKDDATSGLTNILDSGLAGNTLGNVAKRGLLDVKLGVSVNLPGGVSLPIGSGPTSSPPEGCINTWHPAHPGVDMDGCDDESHNGWHWVHPGSNYPNQNSYTWGVSTVVSTQVSTIIACPATVTNCPASSTFYTTLTVPSTTTICPLEVTSTPPCTTAPVVVPATSSWFAPPPASTYFAPPPSTYIAPPVTAPPPPPAVPTPTMSYVAPVPTTFCSTYQPVPPPPAVPTPVYGYPSNATVPIAAAGKVEGLGFMAGLGLLAALLI